MASRSPQPTLILASRSPQRRAILEQLGIEFSVRGPDARELVAGPPREVAVENAYRKASSVLGDAHGSVLGDAHGSVPGEPPGSLPGAGALILGVDTIVCLGSRIYGKPASEEAARATLTALSGRRHSVLSGVCLIEGDRRQTALASTIVEIRSLDEALIDWYLRTGEWRRRAGGYAIQGAGAALVTSIEGDYCNVVGLPVATLLDLAPALLGLR